MSSPPSAFRRLAVSPPELGEPRSPNSIEARSPSGRSVMPGVEGRRAAMGGMGVHWQQRSSLTAVSSVSKISSFLDPFPSHLHLPPSPAPFALTTPFHHSRVPAGSQKPKGSQSIRPRISWVQGKAQTHVPLLARVGRRSRLPFQTTRRYWTRHWPIVVPDPFLTPLDPGRF
jgi:hypothetical protein